jgi:amidase
MDVVVPHTRTMADMCEVLDVLIADDPNPRGDLWRTQPWVKIRPASNVRPKSYPALLPRDRDAARQTLAGKRFGVPRMYVNADPEAGVGEGLGIGGPTGQRIETRQSILDLFRTAGADLVAAGADVVLVDFPVVSNYEHDRDGVPSIKTRGLVSPEFLEREVLDLSAWAWDDFLRANGDPNLPNLAAVDGSLIWVNDPGALPDRVEGFGEGSDEINIYPDFIREHPYESFLDIPHLEEGLRGLERTRKVDFEEWMHRRGLDAVIFPTVADVGPADMDANPASADLGWRNGVWVANGNLVPRHLGIPTVTVPMGTMADIGMPVGLTFAGRAYDDNALLGFAAAFEATGERRTPPPRTPPL